MLFKRLYSLNVSLGPEVFVILIFLEFRIILHVYTHTHTSCRWDTILNNSSNSCTLYTESKRVILPNIFRAQCVDCHLSHQFRCGISHSRAQNFRFWALWVRDTQRPQVTDAISWCLILTSQRKGHVTPGA